MANTAPIFTPFVMAGGQEKERTPVPMIHPGQQQMQGRQRAQYAPVVPDPTRASGVRPVPPPRQRYRVIQPVSRSQNPYATMTSNIHDARYRKARPALGGGEVLGKTTHVSTSFAKTASLLPSKTRKRVFFEDVDEDTLAARVLSESGQQGRGGRDGLGSSPPKLHRKDASGISFDTRHNMHREPDDDERMGILVGREVEVRAGGRPSSSAGPSDRHDAIAKDEDEHGRGHGHDHDDVVDGDGDEADYEEMVDIDGLEEVDEVAPQLSPNIMRRERDEDPRHVDLRGASLRDGGTIGGYTHLQHVHKMRANAAAVKQLSGENSYLKDQLDACYYRIKQLESLLMDRNMRLKNLLTENLKISAKCKKLERELGEDAAQEALERLEREERVRMM